MKLLYIILLAILSTLTQSLSGQKIEIYIPAKPNTNFALALNKGIVQDTIAQGVLNNLGRTTITIPESAKDYVGVASFFYDSSQAINIIINHENFELEIDKLGNYIFTNSPENSAIYGKVASAADTTMYAHFLINTVAYINQLNTVANNEYSTLMQRTSAREYALKRLNWDKLYTSSLWFFAIDGLMRLDNTQEQFADNMLKILNRVVSTSVYTQLVNNIIVITEQYGWEDAFNIIIPKVEKSGRIPVPQGKIYTAFELAKLQPGSIAPQIEGLSTTNTTLLIFYESTCEHCLEELQKLTANYPLLEQKGIKIISISADIDETIFKNEALKLPWVDKLCDLKGFAGKNFKDYGILATPTIFLIDRNKKIIKRYATVASTGLLD